MKKLDKASPGQQMMMELEQKFFTWQAQRDARGNLNGKLRIACRHCPYEDTFNDTIAESFMGAGDRFIQHLKTRHANLLREGVRVDLL